MEGDLEPSIASMCNPLTLQTDDKGFFLPYADSVAETVGSDWVENVFGKLKTDEERIKIFFTDDKLRSASLGPLLALRGRRRAKDAGAARAARAAGAAAMEAGRRREALQLFSQAVVRAPHPLHHPHQRQGGAEGDGGELAVALAARAEVLREMRLWGLALRDLRAADRIGHPHLPRFQLLWRMSRCHLSLGQPRRACVALRAAQALLQKDSEVKGQANAHAARVLRDDLAAAEAVVKETTKDEADADADRLPQPPPLSAGAGRLPGASSLVGVASAPGEGRFAVAAAAVAAGDTLFAEAPLAACLLPDFFASHCHHCMRRLVAPVACGQCAGLAFCGEPCLRAGARAHAVECLLGDALQASGASVLCRIALRIASQAPGAAALFATDIHAPRTESAEAEAYVCHLRRLQSLETHTARRPPHDFLQRSLMALLLLRLLRIAGFFGDQPCADEAGWGAEAGGAVEVRVGGLLLRWLQLLQFNAHEVYETRMQAPRRFKGARPHYVGAALYPSAALCNHSCYPALARFFVGTTLVLRALRPLAAGEAVAENYGPAFVKFPVATRRRALLSRYWFSCRCQACAEDWPTFQNMDNGFRLRCPSPGCPGLLPAPESSFSPPASAPRKAKCLACGRRVSLEAAVAGVREAEEGYERALERMDAAEAAGAAAVAQAVDLLCAYVQRMHLLGAPPKRNLHLAQEALRICVADAGNTACAGDLQ